VKALLTVIEHFMTNYSFKEDKKNWREFQKWIFNSSWCIQNFAKFINKKAIFYGTFKFKK